MLEGNFTLRQANHAGASFYSRCCCPQPHASAVDQPGYSANQEPLFYVDVRPPLPDSGGSGGRAPTAAVSTTRVVNMTNAEGKRFQCELPSELPPGAKLLTQRALRRRRTILPPDIRTTTRKLFGSCSIWGEGQYWQYELCHGKTVTQFHRPTVRPPLSPTASIPRSIF